MHWPELSTYGLTLSNTPNEDVDEFFDNNHGASFGSQLGIDSKFGSRGTKQFYCSCRWGLSKPSSRPAALNVDGKDMDSLPLQLGKFQ